MLRHEFSCPHGSLFTAQNDRRITPAAWFSTRDGTMNGKDAEITKYLRFLLEHQGRCELEQCPSCLTLQCIFELIRSRLFSSSVYPEVMISATSAACVRGTTG